MYTHTHIHILIHIHTYIWYRSGFLSLRFQADTRRRRGWCWSDHQSCRSGQYHGIPTCGELPSITIICMCVHICRHTTQTHIHTHIYTYKHTCWQNKPLIVIVNDRLMDNHQRELADAMAEKQYLIQVNIHTVYIWCASHCVAKYSYDVHMVCLSLCCKVFFLSYLKARCAISDDLGCLLSLVYTTKHVEYLFISCVGTRTHANTNESHLRKEIRRKSEETVGRATQHEMHTYTTCTRTTRMYTYMTLVGTYSD